MLLNRLATVERAAIDMTPHTLSRLVSLLVLVAVLVATPDRTTGQAVDWATLLRELTESAEAPPQSRIAPGALRAIESRAVEPAAELMKQTTPRSLPATETTRNGRGMMATPVVAEALVGPSRGSDAQVPVSPAAPVEAERPPDLEAYGRLANAYGDSMISRTTQGVETFRARMRQLARAVPEVPASLAATLRAASEDGTLGFYLELLGIVALMIAATRVTTGILGPTVGRSIMTAVQRHSPPDGMAGKLPVLATRIVLTTALILTGLIVASAVGFLLLPKHRTAEVSAGLFVGFYGLYVVIDAMWRMVISPYLPAYRIPKIEDGPARRLYLWLSACVLTSLLSETILLWLDEVGAEADVIVIASIVLRFLAVVLIIAMVWVNREAVREAILGGRHAAEANWAAVVAALIAPLVVSVYFIAAWFEGSVRLVLGLKQGLPLFLGPFVTLMVSLLVYAVATFMVEVYFRRARLRDQLNAAANEAAEGFQAEVRAPTTAEIMAFVDDSADADDDGPGPMPTRAPRMAARALRPSRRPHMRTFEDLGYRVASLIAAGVGAYMMLRIWAGPGVFQDGGAGDWIGDILDKLLLGYIAYHGVRIWLDQRIEEEGGDMAVSAEPGDEGGGASATSRLGTLLPLLRSFILVTIGLSVGVLVAMDFGINVAPLFAGAGIVGLALGFGAQTLVRDILSGMFFLIDDAFRKGEYIDVGEVKGTVEKISLRSFQLRHHLGALNTIPFGEIKHLTNFSRDWVITKLPLRLTYDTDVEKVRKLIKRLGEDLQRHPTEGHKFVQPLKSQGVYQMEDSAMIIRVKFMTRPGDQWTTRKLVYQEIRSLFEREGIKFAHREVLVRVPDLPGGPSQRAEVAGAAARRALEEAETPVPFGAYAEGR